jgi:hypothetical protein
MVLSAGLVLGAGLGIGCSGGATGESKPMKNMVPGEGPEVKMKSMGNKPMPPEPPEPKAPPPPGKQQNQ